MNAYSEDLRKKIVEALGRGTTKSEAARAFSVSRSSLKRYAKLAEDGRPLAPKKRPGSKPKIDESARRLLEADLEARPPRQPSPSVGSTSGGWPVWLSADPP
jgi:transposase